jgi:hypothetical protein
LLRSQRIERGEGHVSGHNGGCDIERIEIGKGRVSGHKDFFDHRESREVKDMSLATMIVSINENGDRTRTCLCPQWRIRSQRIERGEEHVTGHNGGFDHRESREIKDMSLVISLVKENRREI